TVLFAGKNGTNGHELWKSEAPFDAAHTTMVKDINPGGGDSSPEKLANIGGTLLFRASDGDQGVLGAHSQEPWKSDGTSSGTQLVKDINTNASFDTGRSRPYEFTNVGGSVFFQARASAADGYELWRSDPPFNDATEVQINAGGNGQVNRLTNVGGTLFFSANDGTNGQELWKSVSPFDAGHTTMVKDINPAGGSSYPNDLTNIGGTLFFGAQDGTNGFELWKSVGPDFNDASTTQ